MEICWLYAWAAFSLTAVIHRPFSFWGAMVTFIGAGILTGISTGKGWRVIYVAGVQVSGFLCAGLWVLHDMYYMTHPLLGTGWCLEFVHNRRTPLEWLILVLVIFWILFLWVSGITFSRRPGTYYTLCSRFDIGLAAFFGLFIMKLLLAAKGGIRIDDQVSFALIFPFFLLGLMGIGMTKDENRGTVDFLPGYRGVGVMVGFIAMVFLSAGSLALFFIPVLTSAATVGYHVLHTGAGWAMPIIETVLRFVFGGRTIRPEPAGSSTIRWAPDRLFGANSWWMSLIEKILAWGIKGFMVLFLLCICGMLVYYVLKWLFSRTSYNGTDTKEIDERDPWYKRLWKILVFLYKTILQHVKGYHRAAELFHVLLRWGDHSGLRRSIDETPLEFGARLERSFPRLQREISLIIAAFNSEVYGGVKVSDEYFRMAQSALMSLRHPRHWPLRFKTRFFNSGGGYLVS